MQSKATTAITAVKQDVCLREWAEQLEAQQASGLTVSRLLMRIMNSCEQNMKSCLAGHRSFGCLCSDI